MTNKGVPHEYVVGKCGQDIGDVVMNYYFRGWIYFTVNFDYNYSELL